MALRAMSFCHPVWASLVRSKVTGHVRKGVPRYSIAEPGTLTGGPARGGGAVSSRPLP
jgi:hypothetical protein